MKEPITLNGIELNVFGAEALSFEIGAHKLSNLYLGLSDSIKPIKLNELKSYREITLNVEFFDDDELKVAENQSNFTQYLLEHELELKLPDGFVYTCTLSSVGKISRKVDFIYTCKYKFVGFRHKDKVTLEIAGTKKVYIEGNDFADAVFTISGTEGVVASITQLYADRYGGRVSTLYKVTLSNQPVVIDGINKIVTHNGVNTFKNKAAFSQFPKLKAGENQFNISFSQPDNAMKMIIEYFPTFA